MTLTALLGWVHWRCCSTPRSGSSLPTYLPPTLLCTDHRGRNNVQATYIVGFTRAVNSAGALHSHFFRLVSHCFWQFSSCAEISLSQFSPWQKHNWNWINYCPHNVPAAPVSKTILGAKLSWELKLDHPVNFQISNFLLADAIQLKMPLTLIQISTIPKIASTKASYDKCIANMFYFNIPFNLLFSNLIINGHYLLAPQSAKALKANRQLAGSDSYQLTTIAIIDQNIIWL